MLLVRFADERLTQPASVNGATMIHVVAIITTAPGKRAEVLEAFADIVPTVHAEDGCIEYQPVVDDTSAAGIETAVGDDTFFVIEKWETLAALQAHSAAPHMQDYGKRVGHLVVGRAVHILRNA